ncbi:MAG: hypothetical protein JOY54_04350 [Acidobacteriaceae bacterium]|nr:hypothetical protein [Acidobacteriaceae bacterium]
MATAVIPGTEAHAGNSDTQQPSTCLTPKSIADSTLNPTPTVCVPRLAETFEPIDSNGSGINQSNLGQNTEEGSNGQVEPLEEKGNYRMFLKQTDLATMTARLQDCSVAADAPQSTVETALIDLTRKSEELVDKQARLFEESLARIGSKSLSQAEASVRRAVSRLENCFAEAQELKSTMDDSLANLARKMTEAAQGQINALEENLANIAGQIGTRIQAELDPVATRMESYRAQVQEMDAAFETTLTRFTQKMEEAAQGQTRSLEEKIASISEHAVSQAQDSFHGGMMQLREAAERSFEDRIACLSESVERHLKESFEAWSKAQLEIVQQQADKLSADLLGQLRAESETVVHHLHERLKSDAQLLETQTLQAVQGKLQKVMDEVQLTLGRAFA